MTRNYGAYHAVSTDGTRIFTSSLVDGSATCTPSPGCPCGSATHTPKAFNKIGSVGGWGSGSPQRVSCYPSYQNNQSIVATPGVVYTFQSEGQIICSIAGTFYDSPVPPQPVQLPKISGPATVWWFNGKNPNAGQYPISITLTSSAGAPTRWSLQQPDAKVNLSATSGASIQVTSTGQYYSGNVGDISITALDPATNIKSSPFTITSRTPWKLVFLPAQSATTPLSGNGYLSELAYDLIDQLSSVIPQSVTWNETVTNTQSQNGSNWGNYAIQTSPGDTGPLIDRLSGPGVNNSPPPYPTPTYHNPATGTTPYRVATQNIKVGSDMTGGVFVQQDTLTYYLDQGGGHTGIIIPPKPVI